ncbi:hypothetical protein ONE63_007823 [Megalurothrips usitatus]|uniref:RecA family profile 1 domain-containing protein n=1 Tax=Megalurothrips usitatus TaxID=439358 RepID=A0AAV7XNV1_9NEOP|nr:hypothetical protein ONE63_007823 [Megalurothrips usitatus]
MTLKLDWISCICIVLLAQIRGPEAVLQVSDFGLLRVGSLGPVEADWLSNNAALSLLNPGYMTALEAEELEQEWGRLSSGCHVIDQAIGGGFPIKGVTELSGQSGCGKTQLCLQLCLSVQYPKSQGGLNGGAVYICTEDTFPAKRLQQLLHLHPTKRKVWTCNKVCLPKFGDNIFIEHVADVTGMRQCVLGRLPKLLSHHRIKLIVIDSVAGVFRSCYDNNEMKSRADDMRTIGGQLHKIASQSKICIICTNQVTASDGAERCVPALGLAWSNLVTMRIQLHRLEPCGVDAAPARSLEVVFAPDLPTGSVPYDISEGGFFGVK